MADVKWESNYDYNEGHSSFLRWLQENSQKWREHSFPPEHRVVSLQVLGVAEETGELAHSILKREQAIRGSDEYHIGQAADAIGDIVIYLAGVCSSLDLDFQTCVQEAWMEVAKRDWSKHKDTGEPE